MFNRQEEVTSVFKRTAKNIAGKQNPKWHPTERQAEDKFSTARQESIKAANERLKAEPKGVFEAAFNKQEAVTSVFKGAAKNIAGKTEIQRYLKSSLY